MKIVLDKIESSGLTLEQFADKYGLTMRVEERRYRDLPRYHAAFDGVEVIEGLSLAGVHGNGETPGSAIADYAVRLRGQRIAVDAFRPTRREIQCPREWDAQ